jgi:hypothetical protein
VCVQEILAVIEPKYVPVRYGGSFDGLTDLFDNDDRIIVPDLYRLDHPVMSSSVLDT